MPDGYDQQLPSSRINASELKAPTLSKQQRRRQNKKCKQIAEAEQTGDALPLKPDGKNIGNEVDETGRRQLDIHAAAACVSTPRSPEHKGDAVRVGSANSTAGNRRQITEKKDSGGMSGNARDCLAGDVAYDPDDSGKHLSSPPSTEHNADVSSGSHDISYPSKKQGGGKTTGETSCDQVSQHMDVGTTTLSKRARRQKGKEGRKSKEKAVNSTIKHREWLDSMFKNIEQIETDERFDFESRWAELHTNTAPRPDAEDVKQNIADGLSRERREILDSYQDDHVLVWCPLYIREVASLEIQFQQRIVSRKLKSQRSADPFDEAEEDLQALVYLSEYAKLCPVPGADYAGSKKFGEQLARQWRIVFEKIREGGKGKFHELAEDWRSLVLECMRCPPFSPQLMSEIESGFQVMLDAECYYDVKQEVGSKTELEEEIGFPGQSAWWSPEYI